MSEYHIENTLLRTGMLSSLHSYNELASAEARADAQYAYCSYFTCAGSNPMAWKRAITKWQRRCPDCGNALIWKEKLKTCDIKRLQKEKEEKKTVSKLLRADDMVNHGGCV